MKRRLFFGVTAVLSVTVFFFNIFSVAPAAENRPQPKEELGGWEVIVMPGDTLSYLCDRYLGNSSSSTCQATADLNGISTEEVLKPGKKLFFPYVFSIITKEKKSGKVVGQTRWYVDEGAVRAEAEIGDAIIPSMRHIVVRKDVGKR